MFYPPQVDKHLPAVIVLHDKDNMDFAVRYSLSELGYAVYSFDAEVDFIGAWENNTDGIWDATALIMHKDIGGGSYNKKNPYFVDDMIHWIRSTDLGQSLRFILSSGEYSYDGVRDESIKILRADAGFDPSGEHIDHHRMIPLWLERFIQLGRVSMEEAQEFRGISIVDNEFLEVQRETWVHNLRRGIERE